jgi:hypothetical protein
MRILGIDPGYAIVGYGIIDKDERGNYSVVDYGAINTPKNNATANFRNSWNSNDCRLAQIHIVVIKWFIAFQPIYADAKKYAVIPLSAPNPSILNPIIKIIMLRTIGFKYSFSSYLLRRLLQVSQIGISYLLAQV